MRLWQFLVNTSSGTEPSTSRFWDWRSPYWANTAWITWKLWSYNYILIDKQDIKISYVLFVTFLESWAKVKPSKNGFRAPLKELFRPPSSSLLPLPLKIPPPHKGIDPFSFFSSHGEISAEGSGNLISNPSSFEFYNILENYSSLLSMTNQNIYICIVLFVYVFGFVRKLELFRWEI